MSNLSKMLFATLLIGALLSSIVPAYAAVGDYPQSDEMYSIICATESVTMTKAKEGSVDTALDIRMPANAEDLRDNYGFALTALLGFGFHYIGINTRSVTPSSSGAYANYKNRVPGMPLFPLNISEFRFALHLIVGGETKDRIISEVFRWTSMRIDMYPTPAAGFWRNPAVYAPHDEAEALRILNVAGFYNDTAHTGLANGIWANTNPAKGPTGEIRAGAGFVGTEFEKKIRVLLAPEAATSTSLVSQKFMLEWNRFFGKNSAGGNYFVEDWIAWGTMLDIFRKNRDFDMFGAGWVTGRDPDSLYNFFHPSNDLPGGYNSPGLNNPALNVLLEAIKLWRFANGTMITDINVMQKIVYEAQEVAFYLASYIVNRAAITPNLFAPLVKGYIESLGYTANNGWTYDFIYKEGTGTIRQSNPGTVANLGPADASSVYEWNILNRVFDGLMAVNPWNKEDVMWAAKSYKIEAWSPPGETYGQKVTFNLRTGITWHDGTPFTADDVLFSWKFIANVSLPRYIDVWSVYKKAEKVDDYTVIAYMNGTGIWYVYDFAGTAMMFPEVIYTPWLGNLAGVKTWQPGNVKYDTWTGQTGHGDLTCLIGTGTWVFVKFDAVGQYAYFKANRPFTLGGSPTWTYTGRYWNKLIRQDINLDFKVDIKDIAMAAKAFGSYEGHPKWEAAADINADKKVDIKDIASIAKKFGYIGWP